LELVLAALGFLYVAYRAVLLPLAPDEWGMLRSIHTHHFVDHLRARDWEDWNAQAQFLNLVLSRACFDLFRFNEIQRIRIPNLLSFGIFLWAIWRISRQFTRRLVGLLAFIALLCNAFVLDYFSVSRSYGLAMAFTTLGLASVLEVSAGKENWAFLAVWSAALAVVSNFSFLYLFVAVLLTCLFLLRHGSLWRLFWLACSAPVVGVFYLPRFMVLLRHKLFFFGGTKGLISDTVMSLVQCMRYRGGPSGVPSSPLEVVLAWTAVGLVIASTIGIVSNRDRRGLSICSCLWATVALISANHYVFGMNFPIERVAMYFFPLFVLQAACLVDCTHHRWVRFGFSGLLVAYSVAAAWGLNLSHMCVSDVMADIPALIQDLARTHQASQQPVVLCLSDGTKWQAWYYAELATKVPENERLKDRKCYARIDWLCIYEPHCGQPINEGRMSTFTTTHLLLSRDDDPPTWFPHQTVLLREYPVSHWRLYGRVEDAIPHDEASLELEPDFADGENNLATALVGDGKYPEAMSHLEQALRRKPDFAEAHNGLGGILLLAGKVPEAMEQLEEAVRLKPNYAEAHSNLGQALVRSGKAAEAIQHFELALRLTSPSGTEMIHNNLGFALLQAGRVPEAVAQYNEALRLEPEDVKAHINLGDTLRVAGKLPEAIQQYEQALLLKPDYGDARRGLGLVFAQQGKLSEAVEQWEQTIGYAPDDAIVQNDLGIALAKLGRLPEAIEHLRRAVLLHPEDFHARYNLGLALEQLGRRAEAAEQYQQCSRLQPDFTPAREALARLQPGE
jgi:tetratricopeptide (TPR) repeat protein